jgi:hypothetical protein
LAPEQLTEELADFAYFELGQLKKHILDGIADDATTKRIEKALDRLSPEKEVNDSIPEDYWINLGKETSEAEYQEYLADLLHKLACEQEEGGAPFVAQGLINSARLEAVGPSYLPDVARRLLAAAENSAADCAGVKGLGPDQTAQLRKWADKELIAEEGRKSENLTK